MTAGCWLVLRVIASSSLVDKQLLELEERDAQSTSRVTSNTAFFVRKLRALFTDYLAIGDRPVRRSTIIPDTFRMIS